MAPAFGEGGFVVKNTVTAILLVAAAAALIAAVATRARIGHPVSEQMRLDARHATGKQLPIEKLILARLSISKTSPDPAATIVLIFIKDECPCSEAAEPCFQRLHSAHGVHARFIGVIEGDEATARSWVDRHKTPYPVIADPSLDLIHACGAKNSAYTALVLPDGSISRLWPGYSAPMLREVSAVIAAGTATPEPTLDVADAPEALTSGCPF
jgi:peroxiredoxin